MVLPGTSVTTQEALPLLPAFGAGSLPDVVPALLDRRAGTPSWVPAELAGARQVVLLVIDGLGWNQLRERPALAPTLTSMTGGPITSVAPSTTACALASISLGVPPAVHGLVGYRMVMSEGTILNLLRWRTSDGDARLAWPPEEVQPLTSFRGHDVPVVTQSLYAGTGFTTAHLSGARLRGWRTPSGIAITVRHLLQEGNDLVYAYYPGLDTVAHEYGFGEHYDAELRAVDALVASIADALPAGAALVVTADHGQVEVDDRVVHLDPAITAAVRFQSGEGRFRWLHVTPGASDDTVAGVRELHGDVAWAVSREQAIDEGWFGGALAPHVAARLGDVAVLASAPVAFYDPDETGSSSMRCRHGSLTADEMLVPLLARLS